MSEQESNFFTSGSSETIGYSERGRPLVIRHYCGRENSDKIQKVKVFILAGQHGDERYGRKAVGKLIDILDGGYPPEFESLQIAILPNANPDGSLMKSRTNALSIDLNRDHLFLNAMETRSIHSFIRSWRPHLVIDVHNYPSKRNHLLEKGLVLHHNVFVDVPTNPCIFVNYHASQNILDQFLSRIKADLQLLGFSCERYCMIKPSGRVRHSTPDVIDARNFIALRYNAMTVLLEGRMPIREDRRVEREFLVSAQLQALWSILTWSVQNKSYLFGIREFIPTQGEKVPTLLKYATANQALDMSFKSSQSGDIKILSLPNYTPDLKVSKYVHLPAGYAIPKKNKNLLSILHRHGFTSISVHDPSISEKTIQYYYVYSVKHSNHEKRRPRRLAAVAGEYDKLILCNDYEIFPTAQLGGHSLAILLEPTSKYGLHRNKESGLAISPESYYPVLRLV
jgi:hypothetical protein